jgi:hypothetical protein
MKKKNEKITNKKRKTRKKLEIFYVFWICQKVAKNRPFWWPPRCSGGGEPGTTKKEKNHRKQRKKSMKTT